MLTKLLVAIVFVGMAMAQPDAPSTAQPPAPAAKEGSWTRLWDGRLARTNAEVVTAKRWWIPSLVLLGATTFDIETTHAGLAHHRCVEANRNFPLYPSRGELYRNGLIESGAVMGLGFLFTKAKAPHWIYDGMATYGTVIHIKGAVGWYRNCW